MSIELFTDKRKKPDARSIEKAVGRSAGNWKRLRDFLETTPTLKSEWKFYGVNYGWANRYIKSGKSVIALYPAKDRFTAQIILKRAQLEAAYEQGVSDSTREAANKATDFNEGRWVFIQVDAKSGIEDVVALVKARLEVR